MGIGTNLHDASSFTVTVDHAVERRSVCCSGDGGLGGARMLSCAMKGISDDRQLVRILCESLLSDNCFSYFVLG